MSDVVIRADNLSKRYRIGTYQPVHDTVRQQLATTLAHPVDVLSSFVRRLLVGRAQKNKPQGTNTFGL